MIVLMAAMALAVGFALISKLQRAITMPITRLADLSRRISDDKDYSIRTTVESTDEIGSLAKSFNEMLAQIQVRDAELKHELVERKRAEERLDHLANYDTVTGLPNRYYFNERLSMALSKAKQSREAVALMFLDLDNFKVVNDTLGHHVGDEVLQYVAHRLQRILRPGEAICRVGGDEFAVILENINDPSQATLVAGKCIKALSGVIDFNGNDVYVSVSIGISLYPQDTTDMHELLKNADTAMYHAKAKGKNTSQIFLPEMTGIAQKRLTVETSLRRAIERNEFHLYYQPLISLPDRQMVGVEALIRWMHPELGVVSPTEFIPLAEETGLIVPIGTWVLRTACAQAKAWNDMGLKPIGVAVNLSGRQFKEDNIVEVVFAALRETGLDPQLLELELTESTLMDSDSATLTKLHELNRVGIKLSVDDFGTGYSSMSSLKNFPISVLKVDRSFVRDLPKDSDDAAITEAIIAMAKSLKIDVTAEGVETEEQARFLEEKNCNRCQGFYFSRPVPALEITALLQKSGGRHPEKIAVRR
jgi:diguanylate cyclase (GGDEF)-like protein